jgi:hypothetical protein
MFRRLLKFQQMVPEFLDYLVRLSDPIAWQDFEFAAWQLTYLCIAPKRVYARPPFQHVIYGADPL